MLKAEIGFTYHIDIFAHINFCFYLIIIPISLEKNGLDFIATVTMLRLLVFLEFGFINVLFVHLFICITREHKVPMLRCFNLRDSVVKNGRAKKRKVFQIESPISVAALKSNYQS